MHEKGVVVVVATVMVMIIKKSACMAVSWCVP